MLIIVAFVGVAGAQVKDGTEAAVRRLVDQHRVTVMCPTLYEKTTYVQMIAVAYVCFVMCQERKFLEQQQESSEAAMSRLADQHRVTVAQLEQESLQLKHQLLRGRCSVS